MLVVVKRGDVKWKGRNGGLFVFWKTKKGGLMVKSLETGDTK